MNRAVFRPSCASKLSLCLLIGIFLILASTATAAAQALTVTVGDQGGAPLANVKTYLFTEAGAYTGRNATTDAAGSADLGDADSLAAGSYKIRADFLGQQFWGPVFDLPAGIDQALTIDMAGTAVTVTSAGQPAGGVKVYLFSAAGAYLGLQQTTDAAGQVGFTLPVGRDFKVRADILGSQYFSPVFQPQAGGSTVEVDAGGGHLSVTLQKAAAQPMAGVKLYLFNTAGAYLGLQQTSDTIGQAAFDVSAGDYRIRADYLGYQFWSQDVNVAADTALDFTIGHQDISFTLAGQFDTPVPLEGVRLYLFTESGSYVGINQDTGADGRINLQLPDRAYKVRADYLSGQYWSDAFQFTDAGLTIPLAQVDLTVVWNGMPLDNVPVYLFTGSGSYTGIQRYTDANGRTSYQLPQSQWQFRADYQTNQYWAAADDPAPGQITPVTLSTGGGTLNLGVTLYQNETQVLEGIKCYVFNDQGDYTGVNGTTDDQGQVAFDLAAGSYQIRVDYLGYQFFSEVYSLSADTTDVFQIPHQQVILTVNGQFDTPVPMAGVKVYLFNAAGAYIGQQDTTDAAGRIVYYLPDKPYKARVDYMGQQYWTAEFDDPAPVLNIPLARPVVTVTGAGQGLAGVTVYAYNQDDAYIGLSGVTDDQGRTGFELPAGRYKFKTACLGHTFWSDPVDLTAAATPEVPINTGGGNFTLTVLKDATTPLANTKCYLFSADGSQYLGRWALTDEYGQAAFDLVDGSFTFRVDHLGYQFFTEAYAVPDTLAAAATIAHQDLEITVNGVLDAPEPLQDVKVYLFSAAGAGAYLGQQQTTGADGGVTFSLPARDFKVRADYMGYQFWSPVFNGQPAGVQIPLGRAAITVSGIGQPLENVPVYAFTGAGAYLGLKVSTGADGVSRFTLPAQQPFKFRADYQGSQFWSDPDGLVAGQDTPVAIDTGGGLFGLRVEKDPYHPLADLKCYVYTGPGTYIGTFGTTDADGRLTFALADGQYKFKVLYAGYTFWTPEIGVPALLQHTLTIAHSRKTIHVQGINPGPEPIAGAKAYLYTDAGAYADYWTTTDASGRAYFDLPGQAYKVSIDYNGQSYWTDTLTGNLAVVSIDRGAGAAPAAVAGLTATVVDAGRIDLAWSAPADTAGLAGFTVYRRGVCQENFAPINTALIDPAATGYSDTAVGGQGAVAYYVVAVNDQGLEGQPGAVVLADPGSDSPGQNTTAVANLAVAWDQGQALLTWDAQDGLDYQVYRGSDPSALVPCRRVDAPPYTDPDADPAQTWYFQVASVQRQCDPASGQPVLLLGPLSAQVTLGAQGSAVAFTSLPINGQGQYLITTGAGAGYSLEGSYSGLLGDVTVTATLGDQTVTGTGADGHFSIDLPTVGNWQIVIEPTGGGPGTTLDTVWQVDDQPPSLTVDGADTRSTSESQVTLTGLAADAASALQAVTVASDQYPGLTFTATLGTMGSFSAQVPLKIGDNLLTVTAADIHGNSAAKAITVTQTLTALPVITITGPADGAVVTTERIDVTGTVRSSLPPEQIRLLLADQVVFAQGSNNLYAFTFTDVTLAPGSNLLTVRAETAYGNVSAQIAVQYGDTAGQDPAEKPVIEVFSPLPDTFLTAATTVTGRVTGPAAITSVTVNDQPVDSEDMVGLGTTSASFKAELSLSGDGAPMDITIVAQDAAGQSASLTYTVYADTTAPVISLADTGLQAPPAVNPATTSPYTVSGTVTDANLAGLSVNDQPVALSPTATAGTYSFAAGLPLTYGSDQSVTVMAWDLAGNQTGTQWIVTLESDLAIEVIAPANGARLQGQGTAMDVAVTVRVAGAAADHRFFAAVDGASAVELTRSGTVGNGTVNVSTAQEDHQLNLSVQNSVGDTLAATTSTFAVQDMDAVPLAVEKLKPANGATGIEPNDFIALYFNKAIDPALLQIEVLETVHGKTYAAATPGADITQLSAVELVEVHRDRETVPGGVSILPGDRIAAFYPARDLAYGATVFINATYDGTELTRATYAVRSLPTFIEGFVADTWGNPVKGVTVSIPDLGLTSQSNADGGFGFGFKLKADRNIAGGRYRAFYNPAMKNPGFGMVEQWVNVQEGRLNNLAVAKLPLVDPAIPYRRIVSGQNQAVLADGALVLDLSAAQLTFADLRDQGDVHVQLVSAQELAYPQRSTTPAYWLFNVQPAGIEVSGDLGLKMAVPMLNGSYTYVRGRGTYFVLVGLDPESLTIVPVGVGQMNLEDKTIHSVGALALRRLDYLGFALVPAEAAPLLEQFAQGQIGLKQLIAALENIETNQ